MLYNKYVYNNKGGDYEIARKFAKFRENMYREPPKKLCKPHI